MPLDPKRLFVIRDCTIFIFNKCTFPSLFKIYSLFIHFNADVLKYLSSTLRFALQIFYCFYPYPYYWTAITNMISTKDVLQT